MATDSAPATGAPAGEPTAAPAAATTAAPAAASTASPPPPAQELLTLTVSPDARPLTLALCENGRGCFLKIAGSAAPNTGGATDRRAKLAFSAGALRALHGLLTRMATAAAELPAPGAPAAAADKPAAADAAAEAPKEGGGRRPPATPPLLSERMSLRPPRARRVFCDVLENADGRYCKLSTVEGHARGGHGRRSTITFAAGALAELAAGVQTVIDRVLADGGDVESGTVPARRENGGAGSADGARKGGGRIVGESRVVSLPDGKKVHVVAGANRRGSFVRVSDRPGSGGYMVPFSAAASVAAALHELVAVGDPMVAAAPAAAAAPAEGT